MFRYQSWVLEFAVLDLGLGLGNIIGLDFNVCSLDYITDMYDRAYSSTNIRPPVGVQGTVRTNQSYA